MHNKRYARISERIESATLLLQLLFLGRTLTLALGEPFSSSETVILSLTGWLFKPLNAIIPPLEVGAFIFEPASALVAIILPILAWIVAIIVDHIRLQKRLYAQNSEELSEPISKPLSITL